MSSLSISVQNIGFHIVHNSVWHHNLLCTLLIFLHHHRVMLLAYILFCHSSLSSISLTKSSSRYPVSAQRMNKSFCWLTNKTGVYRHTSYRRTSVISLSLLLQQWQTGLVHLTWMVCVMRGEWPNSCFYVRCCFRDLFKTACSILE